MKYVWTSVTECNEDVPTSEIDETQTGHVGGVRLKLRNGRMKWKFEVSLFCCVGGSPSFGRFGSWQAGNQAMCLFGVKVTRETAGWGRSSETVPICDCTWVGQNVNGWSQRESEEEATWCKEGSAIYEPWFHPEKQNKNSISEFQKVQELDVAVKSLASRVYVLTPSTPLWPSVRSRRLRRCWNRWRVSYVVSQFFPHPAEQKKVIVFTSRHVQLKI